MLSKLVSSAPRKIMRKRIEMTINTEEAVLDKINVDKLFSEINTKKIEDSFANYMSSFDLFYTEYNGNTNLEFMRYYANFDPESFSDDRDKKFVFNALRGANYDGNVLRSENVVLFSEPVIVSELSCTNIPHNENEAAVRFISYLETDKKFITKRRINTGLIFNSGPLTTYKVHDVVLGLILPKRSSFYSVNAVSCTELHTNYTKFENTKDALEIAKEAPLIEIANLAGKFEDINSIIKIEADKFKALERNFEVLEQQSSHEKSSLENSRNALNKVCTDLDEANKDYGVLSKSISDGLNELNKIERDIKYSAELDKKAKTGLDELEKKTQKARESLLSIEGELIEGNKKKNLTSLDMVGHANETSRQVNMYYVFAFMTLLGLAAMARYIYQNGESFIDILPLLVDVSAWDILLSRLPLITATTLIIGGLSGVFFFLIKHIVSLNTEKMIMLKAAILAEQITNSLKCTEMSEEEKLEFKRDTKIKLITQVFSKNGSEIKTNFMMDVLKAIKDNK